MRGAAVLISLFMVGAAGADAPPAAAPDPAGFQSHARAADALAASGRWKEATDEYQKALGLEPDFAALQSEADALSAQSVTLQDQVFDAQKRHDDQAADAAQAAKGDADRRLRADQDTLALRDAFGKAHANEGVALDRLDRESEALAQFDAALRLAPALAARVGPLQAGAHQRRGEAEAVRGLSEAVPDYREAIRLVPSLAPAHRGLGQALLAQGRPEEAAGELREAARLAPADARTRLLLGTALIQTGQAVAARAEWESAGRGRDAAVRESALRLLDQYPPDAPTALVAASAAPAAHPKPSEGADVTQARERVRFSPDDPMARNDLGLALHRAGQDAPALAELRRAVRLDPDSDLAHTNLGLVLSGAGQTEAALKEYREALKAGPEDWVAHLNLGALLADGGRWREAEVEFRAAVRFAKDDPGTHLNLGSALAAEGRLPEAAHEFARAAQLGPRLAAAHANLGFVWDRMGRSGESVAEYRRAVELVPDRAQAFLDMARALRDLPNRAQSVASYRAVMGLFPDHAAAHAGLAELLLAAGNSEGAGAEFQAALWRQPDLEAACAGLGRVRLGQGRLDDALRACRQAVALDGADAHARTVLGLALYQSGDKAGGRRQWQQVAASGDAPAAKNAAGLLQEFPEK